jgi:hypothetical protein
MQSANKVQATSLAPLFEFPNSSWPSCQSAHDHPLASALLEKIHKNKLTANVFTVLNPLFHDTGLDQGNIAEHLHVRGSIFKRHEFVIAGFEIF